MKRILLILLSLLSLVSLISCGSQMTVPQAQGGIHTPSGDLYPEEFLSLNGNKISFSEFRYYYLNLKNEYLKNDANYFQKEGTADALKQEAFQSVLDFWSVRLLAKKHHVSLDRKDMEAVQADIDKTIQAYGGNDSFAAMLEDSYMSQSLYQYMMEYSALYMKLFDELYGEDGKRVWDDEAFFAYYRENYLAVREIYLPYETGENAENCPNTILKAQNILQEIQSGADFWKMIETYGKDDNMLDYPDGYYLKEGEAEDVLYQASHALAIGAISQPVCGKSGVYLIQRLELKENRMKENRQTALFGYYDTFNQWHPGAYDQDFQTYYTEFGKELKIEYGKFWDMISPDSVY